MVGASSAWACPVACTGASIVDVSDAFAMCLCNACDVVLLAAKPVRHRLAFDPCDTSGDGGKAAVPRSGLLIADLVDAGKDDQLADDRVRRDFLPSGNYSRFFLSGR
jgi:hypothetical protein